MSGKASELGCSSGDLSCLCSKPDYSYGIRDCTAQACPNDDANAVVSSALASCPTSSGTSLTPTQFDSHW
ncbi:hypothetical protein M747DRAFT_296495 [Aspergillus niger ATCC 13496]|uniref:CFEM domain-containing protein n=1 Tax=Aspergillus niger ATCC 13496 TaxID=1353008 RepID=A0A370BZ26_ASPNG|nr:hypothetical protein M747DRAFT_296495 [Aspergillus niger ATCC 13496]